MLFNKEGSWNDKRLLSQMILGREGHLGKRTLLKIRRLLEKGGA